MTLILKAKMTGQELRAIRKQMGLTQEEIAQKLGVRPNTFARWERNERPIRENIARFVYALHESQRAAKKWLDI